MKSPKTESKKATAKPAVWALRIRAEAMLQRMREVGPLAYTLFDLLSIHHAWEGEYDVTRKKHIRHAVAKTRMSIDQMIGLLGASKRSVQRALRELEDTGWISKEPCAPGTTSIWQLHLEDGLKSEGVSNQHPPSHLGGCQTSTGWVSNQHPPSPLCNDLRASSTSDSPSGAPGRPRKRATGGGDTSAPGGRSGESTTTGSAPSPDLDSLLDFGMETFEDWDGLTDGYPKDDLTDLFDEITSSFDESIDQSTDNETELVSGKGFVDDSLEGEKGRRSFVDERAPERFVDLRKDEGGRRSFVDGQDKTTGTSDALSTWEWAPALTRRVQGWELRVSAHRYEVREGKRICWVTWARPFGAGLGTVSVGWFPSIQVSAFEKGLGRIRADAKAVSANIRSLDAEKVEEHAGLILASRMHLRAFEMKKDNKDIRPGFFDLMVQDVFEGDSKLGGLRPERTKIAGTDLERQGQELLSALVAAVEAGDLAPAGASAHALASKLKKAEKAEPPARPTLAWGALQCVPFKKKAGARTEFFWLVHMEHEDDGAIVLAGSLSAATHRRPEDVEAFVREATGLDHSAVFPREAPPQDFVDEALQAIANFDGGTIPDIPKMWSNRLLADYYAERTRREKAGLDELG